MIKYLILFSIENKYDDWINYISIKAKNNLEICWDDKNIKKWIKLKMNIK